MFALALTNVALVLGWVISGYQRVSEELTRERRTAYADLLCAVQSARRGERADANIADLAGRARLRSSPQMHASRILDDFVAAIHGDEATWERERSRFIEAARYESLVNSATRRWLRRSSVYAPR
ncbi:MAG TPA: hypothetical protein VHM65_09845 [Candidatus Lustribacter sp.]|nr:hypothetical protein [Candidatus Lustribacter sp.]